jgi:ABC-type ATPase with predicted acetyltransferase domain
MVFGDRYVFTPGDLRKARLINEEIARISRVVVHPKFRGIGLGEFLVKETLSKVNAKVIEVLAVMAKYNPFFEKAGMVKVDYGRDEASIEKVLKGFLKEHNFDSAFARSKAYCHQFYNQLDEGERKMLLVHLSEFARQPFVKTKIVNSDLLVKVFSNNGVYLYWINGSLTSRPLQWTTAAR